MFTVVPLYTCDSIFIPIPSLSHNFLHRYRPIPVLFPNFLPFSPVNPFSNTLLISLSFIPTPLSSMVRMTELATFLDSILILSFFPLEYFIAFPMI